MHCRSRAYFWPERILYCICGQCLLPSEKQKRTTKEQFDALSAPYYVAEMGTSRGAKTCRDSRIIMIISKQMNLCDTRKRKGIRVFLRDYQKQGLVSQLIDCNWVDGRKVQIPGSTRTGRQIFQGYQKRTFKIRGKLEAVCQRPGTNVAGTRGEDCPQAVTRIANLRQQAEQPSYPLTLPSHQTRQRLFEERQKAEWKQRRWNTWDNFHLPGPLKPRLRQIGNGRKRGGLLKSGRTINECSNF